MSALADQMLQGGAAVGEVIDEPRPGEASSMVFVGVRDALQDLGWYVVASHHTGDQSGGGRPGSWQVAAATICATVPSAPRSPLGASMRSGRNA